MYLWITEEIEMSKLVQIWVRFKNGNAFQGTIASLFLFSLGTHRSFLRYFHHIIFKMEINFKILKKMPKMFFCRQITLGALLH